MNISVCSPKAMLSMYVADLCQPVEGKMQAKRLIMLYTKGANDSIVIWILRKWTNRSSLNRFTHRKDRMADKCASMGTGWRRPRTTGSGAVVSSSLRVHLLSE